MKNNKIHYKTSKDILHFHGIFVLIFYWIFQFTGYFLYTRLWSKLSKVNLFQARDKAYNKATAWWQDIGVVIHLIITCLVVARGFNWLLPSIFVLSFALYFLLDILCYHIRVLWFDDLGIGYNENERMVWSHRRILFQAIVNFAETILIFAVIYRAYINGCFSQILQKSFSIATTLNKGDFSAPIWIVNCQILISIFFLVVVISEISSIGYSRPEIGKSFEK